MKSSSRIATISCGIIPRLPSPITHHSVPLTIASSPTFHIIAHQTATNFCKALIERDPDKRLGACIDDDSEGWRDIEQHDFFSEFNWDSLKDGSMKPPFNPFDDMEDNVALESMEAIGEHAEKKMGAWGDSDEAKFKSWDFMSAPLFYDEVVVALTYAEENGDLRDKKKSSACVMM
jgi:hypothetical protein